MRYGDELLDLIFNKTGGVCHLCGKSVSRIQYGTVYHPRSWEADHNVARVLGGSDHFRNLYPACPSCNRSKQAMSSRDFRRLTGYKPDWNRRTEPEEGGLGEALLMFGLLGLGLLALKALTAPAQPSPTFVPVGTRMPALSYPSMPTLPAINAPAFIPAYRV